MMKALGRHLLVDCYDCSVHALNDLDRVQQAMLATAEAIGATVVSSKFHRFTPQGVSGAIVIAESHLTVHTWPEHRYAAIDFFTCGDCDPHKGVEYLATALGSPNVNVTEVARGFVKLVHAGACAAPIGGVSMDAPAILSAAPSLPLAGGTAQPVSSADYSLAASP